MHFRAVHFHHGKRWQRADNHMDCRHCPHCGATVNGPFGQKAHLQWHVEQAEHENRLADTIEELCKRTGITEETVEVPWTWHAAVDDGSEEQEAIGG